MSYVLLRGDGREREARAAERLYSTFHQFAPGRRLRLRCERRIPETLVSLGKLRALIYESDRGQCGRPRCFVHRFEMPPALLADPRGRKLFVLSDRLRVTRNGLEG
jgi:hypothetical protein